jgi:hypothetical protein
MIKYETPLQDGIKKVLASVKRSERERVPASNLLLAVLKQIDANLLQDIRNWAIVMHNSSSDRDDTGGSGQGSHNSSRFSCSYSNRETSDIDLRSSKSSGQRRGGRGGTSYQKRSITIAYDTNGSDQEESESEILTEADMDQLQRKAEEYARQVVKAEENLRMQEQRLQELEKRRKLVMETSFKGHHLSKEQI